MGRRKAVETRDNGQICQLDRDDAIWRAVLVRELVSSGKEPCEYRVED